MQGVYRAGVRAAQRLWGSAARTPLSSSSSVAAAAASSSTTAAAAPPQNSKDSNLGSVDPASLAADAWTNTTPYILNHTQRQLHRMEGHPLQLIKRRIEQAFAAGLGMDARTGQGSSFTMVDNLAPYVTTNMNFDELLTPAEHPSRSRSDTYYLNETHVLRCHTSAHQAQMLRAGHRAFLVTGDVYRRDTIDRTHYPVFHQMEGVRIFDKAEAANAEAVTADLRDTLEGLVQQLFGKVECRWVEAYFPFTEPSLELEILYRGEWLEVLGCGNVRREILERAGMPTDPGAWAFGLGLERLAMVLYQIADIRTFWSTDDRFLQQFRGKDPAEPVTFQPYSKYPHVDKDISFWVLDPAGFHENDLMERVRAIGSDLVECVECVDKFDNPKTGRTSLCYRVTFQSMERSLTHEEVNKLLMAIRDDLPQSLPIELR